MNCVASNCSTPVNVAAFMPKHWAFQYSSAIHDKSEATYCVCTRTIPIHPEKSPIAIATTPAINRIGEYWTDDGGALRFPGFRLADSIRARMCGFSRYHARVPDMARVKKEAVTDQSRADSQAEKKLKIVENAATRMSDQTSLDSFTDVSSA